MSGLRQSRLQVPRTMEAGLSQPRREKKSLKFEPLAKVKFTIIYHLNLFHNLLLFSNIFFHRDPETSSG